MEAIVFQQQMQYRGWMLEFPDGTAIYQNLSGTGGPHHFCPKHLQSNGHHLQASGKF